MSGWIEAMPPGMFLKSDGFASNLYDPDDKFTLEAFCADKGLPYHPTNRPVPLETFSAYGLAFQQRFAPDVEDKKVAGLTQHAEGFQLGFEDGSAVAARQVVVATGIRNFAHMPVELAGLPEALATHSSRYGDLTRLAGREVAVVGAGASAIDIACLLQDLGGSVRVVTRSPAIRFHSPPRDRTLIDSLVRPMTGLGPSWRSYLCVHAPLVFHAMPERFRLDVVRRHLGPAPGWFMRTKMESGVNCLTESRIVQAGAVDGRAQIVLAQGDGSTHMLSVDHVVAATGYQVDLARVDFLSTDMRDRIRLTGGSPALSTHFESSVRGLYFVGAVAADSFGPLLRFAYGARFAARRVSQSLKHRAGRPEI